MKNTKDNYTVTTSHHSVERAKERFHLRGNRFNRDAELAFQRGVDFDQCGGKEKQYLARKEAAHAFTIAKAYDGKLYIFDYKCNCITVFPLPNWWNKPKAVFVTPDKEKKRNPKKYSKFHCADARFGYEYLA